MTFAFACGTSVMAICAGGVPVARGVILIGGGSDLGVTLMGGAVEVGGSTGGEPLGCVSLTDVGGGEVPGGV